MCPTPRSGASGPKVTSESYFVVSKRMTVSKTFPPILSALWREKGLAWAIFAAASAQVVLVSAGLPGWPCPLRTATGVPCPGCGLSRATAALFRGDLSASLRTHAYAPLVILALLFTGLALLLPKDTRLALISRVETLERRTGVTALALVGLVVYWLVRLLFFPEALARVVAG